MEHVAVVIPASHEKLVLFGLMPSTKFGWHLSIAVHVQLLFGLYTFCIHISIYEKMFDFAFFVG